MRTCEPDLIIPKDMWARPTEENWSGPLESWGQVNQTTWVFRTGELEQLFPKDTWDRPQCVPCTGCSSLQAMLSEAKIDYSVISVPFKSILKNSAWGHTIRPWVFCILSGDQGFMFTLSFFKLLVPSHTRHRNFWKTRNHRCFSREKSFF
jgi:hypothetical protein